jgi:Tol biopolymer transport system component
MRALLMVVLAAAMTAPAPAFATFPGVNGRIAFQRATPNGLAAFQLYSVRRDGTGLRALTAEQSPDAGRPHISSAVTPAYSPDGRRIAFSGSTGHGYSLWTMDAAGTNAAAIPGVESVYGQAPSFAADGRTVALQIYPCSGCRSEIQTVGIDGSNRRTIATSPVGAPAWSPRGDRIAFDAQSDFGSEIATVGADGEARGPVPGTGFAEGYRASAPDWSPGGTRVVFALQNALSRHSQVMVVRVRDGRRRVVVDSPLGAGTRALGDPAYSPDGRFIAFVRGEGCGPQTEIRVVRSRGGRSRRVTRGCWPVWQAHPASSKPTG